MRVLILVDVWNFRLSAKELTDPDTADNIWYAALANHIATELQLNQQAAVTQLRLQMYLSNDDGNGAKLVKRALMTERDAKQLIRQTRRLLNEPRSWLPHLTVGTRAFASHAGHWRARRVDMRSVPEAQDDPPTAQNAVRIERHMTAEIVEKCADTMLASDATKAATLGTHDVIVICTQDQDLRPVIEQLPELARAAGRQTPQVYNGYPVNAEGEAKHELRCRSAPALKFTPDQLRDCAFPPRARRNRDNWPLDYRKARYGLDEQQQAETMPL